MEHMIKTRNQSIQRQQQEIAVSDTFDLQCVLHVWLYVYSVCIYVDLHLTLSIDSIQNYREEAKKQRQLIQALERERDRYGKDAADAQQGCISQVPCAGVCTSVPIESNWLVFYNIIYTV